MKTPKIQTVIIDDERKSIELLIDMLLEFCPDVNVIGTANSVQTGKKLLQEVDADLVFLDIAMPDGYGFDLLDAISNQKFKVIFITAYNEYAVRAFEFSALHYLLKPINYEALEEAVARFRHSQLDHSSPIQDHIFRQALNKSFDRIALPAQNSLEFVVIRDIKYLKASGSYTEFLLTDGSRIIVSKTLSKYEDLLGSHGFHRVHDKYLINLNKVKSYVRGRGGYVLMDDGTEVSVSVRKKDEFLRMIGSF